MGRLFRKGWLVQAVALLFILSLSSSSLAAGLSSARVIPQGTIHIFDGDQKVGELNSEAPLPVGKILTSDQKCGVRLDGVFLVADENARFSVRALSGGTDIFVQQGRVYFALSNLNYPLSLSTPQDTVTVESTLINASTDTSSIRGYLFFENNQMEIGVIEGGKLVVANARGQQMIESGSSLQLQKVQAELGAGGAAAGAGGLGAAGIAAIAVAAVALGVLVVSEVTSSDDTTVPPSGKKVTSPFIP